MPDEGQTIIVGSDDSILSIAKANGFFWKTIWEHGKNAGLKAKRKDPEVLQEGDEVYVPKPEPKKVSKPNEARHKFKLKGEQAKFKIQLKRLGKPRAGEAYVLTVDGVSTTGSTDGDGWIKCDIPNDASSGKISLKNGKEIIPISIGRLDPQDSPQGVIQRLTNLGFTVESGDGSVMPAEALKLFQAKNELKVTGECDGPTKSKLKELHPS
ncbi:MAG: peptidoglycan-binding domain-containing protein [Chthoniobacteraceae bacterium]